MKAKKSSSIPKRLSESDTDRFLKARLGYGDIAGTQILQWVSRGERCTEEVAKGDLRPEMVCAFWISIYGVLYDVRNHVSSLRDMLLGMQVDLLVAFGLSRSFLPTLDEAVASIDRTSAVLNEDELAYLELRRHVECHPLQSGFELAVNDGKIVDRHRKLTKRTWTYEEEDAAFRRVVRKYAKLYADGFDEAPIARAFAARLARPLHEAAVAIGRVYTARPKDRGADLK